MANNVNTYVSFENISDAGKAKLQELTSRIRTDGTYRWMGDMWVDGKEGSPTYEETEQYTWTTEFIGPKWNYLEDYGDDFLSIVSAWSWPEDGIRWIVEQIAEVDKEFRVRVSYEDEMPNFFGAALYEADGLVDYIEWDSDEIQEMLHDDHPDLVEHWNDEEEDGDEEYWDLRSEYIYEWMSDKQYEWFKACLDE